MLPDIQIQVNIYPDLLTQDEYVHVLKNEAAIGTMEMTEDRFLQLCAISSENDAAHYQQEHTEQRFIIEGRGLVPKEFYFEQAWKGIAAIKATNELLAKHKTYIGKDTNEYNCEVAAFMNDHDCLQSVLGSDLMRAAWLYIDLAQNPDCYQLDDDFATERYSSVADLHRSLFSALDRLDGKLKQDCLSLEPCATLTEAMWRYGYLRFDHNVSYRKCGKAGCKEYFACGPGGQMSRKHCKIHLR